MPTAGAGRAMASFLALVLDLDVADADDLATTKCAPITRGAGVELAGLALPTC